MNLTASELTRLSHIIGHIRDCGIRPPLVNDSHPFLSILAWMGVDLCSPFDSNSTIAKRTFDTEARLWMPWAQVAYVAGQTRSLRLLDVAQRCARRARATMRSLESPIPWTTDARSLCPLMVLRGVAEYQADGDTRDASHYFLARLRAVVVGAATRLSEKHPDGEPCGSFCKRATDYIVLALSHTKTSHRHPPKQHPDIQTLVTLAVDVAAWPSVMALRRGAPCDARSAFSVLSDALTITILYRLGSSKAIQTMASASRPFCTMVCDPDFWRRAYAALPGAVTDARPHLWGKDWRWLYRAFTTSIYPTLLEGSVMGHVYYCRLQAAYHGTLYDGRMSHGYGVMVSHVPLMPVSRYAYYDAKVLEFAWKDEAEFRFDGLWSYGLFMDGLCSFTYASGVRFEGLFRHRSVAGGQESYSKGLMMYGNGGRYEGECLAGKRHGHGVYTFVDGTQHEGGCPRDRLGGAGKEMLHRKNDLEADGTRYDGTWEADRFVGAAAAFP